VISPSWGQRSVDRRRVEERRRCRCPLPGWGHLQGAEAAAESLGVRGPHRTSPLNLQLHGLELVRVNELRVTDRQGDRQVRKHQEVPHAALPLFLRIVTNFSFPLGECVADLISRDEDTPSSNNARIMACHAIGRSSVAAARLIIHRRKMRARLFRHRRPSPARPAAVNLHSPAKLFIAEKRKDRATLDKTVTEAQAK
jgi:hypothetical protein